MYQMIIEQTKAFKKRIKYDSSVNIFYETEFDSLFYVRNCPYPYGWLKGSGTPPNKHLDVILVSEDDYRLGDEVPINIIGVFQREDGDHKLLATPELSDVQDLSDLSDIELDSLYRLYPHISEQEGWFGKTAAMQICDDF